MVRNVCKVCNFIRIFRLNHADLLLQILLSCDLNAGSHLIINSHILMPSQEMVKMDSGMLMVNKIFFKLIFSIFLIQMEYSVPTKKTSYYPVVSDIRFLSQMHSEIRRLIQWVSPL